MLELLVIVKMFSSNFFAKCSFISFISFFIYLESDFNVVEIHCIRLNVYFKYEFEINR